MVRVYSCIIVVKFLTDVLLDHASAARACELTVVTRVCDLDRCMDSAVDFLIRFLYHVGLMKIEKAKCGVGE